MIKSHPFFLEDKFSQVEGESVGVIENDRLFARNLFSAGSLGGGNGIVEHSDSVFESAQERIFFFLDDADDEFALCGKFRIGLAHRFNQGVYQAIHECLFLVEERIGIADSAAQDAAYDVAGFGVGGELGVGDGEGYRADMVGDHAHSDIRMALFAVTFS